MSNFENFLCFSSAMARCVVVKSARRLSYHLIIDERNEKTDLNLSFTKETIGFYFQRAILAVDSL